jgi:hypothetical protein
VSDGVECNLATRMPLAVSQKFHIWAVRHCRFRKSPVVRPIFAPLALGKGEIASVVRCLLLSGIGHLDSAHRIAPRHITKGDDTENGRQERLRAVEGYFPRAGAAIEDIRHFTREPRGRDRLPSRRDLVREEGLRVGGPFFD